ncbi:hypothetical protein Tco_0370887 [Tanacetum coccineum]
MKGALLLPGDSDDCPSEQDEVTLIDHTTIEKTQNQRVSTSAKAVGKRKHTAKSFEREPRHKVRKVPPQASKVADDAYDPLDVDSDPDIHEISLEKLYDIHDRAYMRHAVLDNMLNNRTRKLISTLSKAKASCDAIREREVEKDKAYAELERKCNEALQDLDKNPLVNYEQTLFILRSKVEGLESERERLKSSKTQLLQEIDGLRQDKAAVVSKVGPYVAMKLVATLKEPFDLEKMHGYRSSSKKEFDQASDDLATASYPFIAEATADPYASLKKLLSKKPKSLRTKPALLNFKPLSLGAPVN